MKLELLRGEESAVVDTWGGDEGITIFDAGPAEAGGWGNILDLVPALIMVMVMSLMMNLMGSVTSPGFGEKAGRVAKKGAQTFIEISGFGKSKEQEEEQEEGEEQEE